MIKQHYIRKGYTTTPKSQSEDKSPHNRIPYGEPPEAIRLCCSCSKEECNGTCEDVRKVIREYYEKFKR